MEQEVYLPLLRWATVPEMLDPLDYNQGAPVGFLLAVKGVISAFGASEWALRLVPFAASVLPRVQAMTAQHKALPVPQWVGRVIALPVKA